MANEKKTDLWVHDRLKEAGIHLEPNKSSIKEIDEALKTASKRGTGKIGFPEYIGTVKDYLLVIEDKANLDKHIKKDEREIERNKKRFGDKNVKYVFVNKKNKRISVNTINKHMQRKLKENNVLGRDGKILSCTTHQFRATLATNLIATGTSPEVTSQLLGHSNIGSTSSYIGVDKETAKEQLAPRLEKDEMLIRNIGKKDQLLEPSTENTIALCNGFCGKNSLTNPCAKANACYSCSLFIPSKQFLHVYDMQLTEIEASIQIAETNGYELMLKKALTDKENLLKILSKLNKEGPHV